jgi:ribonucleoside-diphosphate reductase alpha chain
MQGVLDISEKKDIRPKFIERTDAPKRPDILPCDIHEISVNKERHIVLIGKLQGTLYEIFVTNDPDNQIEKIGKKEGVIKKKSKGQYQLLVENGEQKVIFDNISEKFDNVYASLSRFISMGLRHGVNLQFIVNQLQKDKNFLGFERAVSRVLKKYIKDGEKVLSSEKCESCGGELIYREGCISCLSCGWSKCG